MTVTVCKCFLLVLTKKMYNLLGVGNLQDCQVDVAKASFDVRQPDKELWKKVCRGFLKGRLPSQQQQAVAL